MEDVVIGTLVLAGLGLFVMGLTILLARSMWRRDINTEMEKHTYTPPTAPIQAVEPVQPTPILVPASQVPPQQESPKEVAPKEVKPEKITEKFICKVCNREFPKKANLVRHFGAHALDDEVV